MIIRAKYYDAEKSNFNYQRAEAVINSFDPQLPNSDINDILELYNIICYFNNKQFPSSWNEATTNNYIATVHQMRAVVGRFFHGVQGENLSDMYEQIDFQLKESFFSALSHYHVTERITPAQLSDFMEKQSQAIGLILRDKALVIQYGQVIAEHLINNISCAEYVIKHCYEKRNTAIKTYMPKEMSQEQQSCIISNYVDWENANVNYLELISKQKTAGEYPVKDKVRFRAHKRVREFWKNHFSKGETGFRFGVEVIFRDQDQVVRFENKSDSFTPTFSYSNQWISDHLDYPTLLNNFIYVFQYTDLCFRCQFLSNPNDMGAVERLAGVHGNREYSAGLGYRFQNMCSNLQMSAYQNALQRNGIEIESLYKWFFEDYLKVEFGIENYLYCAPTPQASDLEKALLIASQFDAVLKQYRLYLEDGLIDRDLFEFSSSAYKMVDTPSRIDKKYVYPCGKAMESKLFYLFSNQSLLSYTKETTNKYDTLASLLENELIKMSDYSGFLHNNLKWLLEQGVLYIDESDYLRVPHPLIDLLFDLYKNGSIVYTYCSEPKKALVDEMIEKGELESESKLFTRQEQDYLDYMLNVQQFDNGPELRNKYVHGNFPIDPEKHKQDYIEMLKIMTLIVIKINEEFCLAFPTDKQ